MKLSPNTSVTTQVALNLYNHRNRKLTVQAPNMDIALTDLNSKQVISFEMCPLSTREWVCSTKVEEVYQSWSVRGNRKYAPKRVEALDGVKVKGVSCGNSHIALCTEDGKAFTFGVGREGQLGHGNRPSKEENHLDNPAPPTLVQALEGRHIVSVQCSGDLTVALTSSEYIYTWGEGHTCAPSLHHALMNFNVIGLDVKSVSGAITFAAVVDSSPSTAREQLDMRALLNDEGHSDVIFTVEGQNIYS